MECEIIIIVCGQWLMDIVEEGKIEFFFYFKTISDKDYGVMSARRQMLDI